MNVFIPLFSIMVATTPAEITVAADTHNEIVQRATRAFIHQGSKEWKDWLVAAPAPVLELDGSVPATSVDFAQMATQYGAVVTGNPRVLTKGIQEGLDGYYLEGHMPTLFVVILDTPQHREMTQWVMGKAALRKPVELPVALQVWIDSAPGAIHVVDPYSNPEGINWNDLASRYCALMTTQYDIVIAAQERGFETYNIRQFNRSFYIILLNKLARPGMIDWLFGNKTVFETPDTTRHNGSVLTQQHIPEMTTWLKQSPFKLYELKPNVDPETIDWEFYEGLAYAGLITQQWGVVAHAQDCGFEVYQVEKRHVDSYHVGNDICDVFMDEKIYFIVLDGPDKNLLTLWILRPDIFTSTRSFLPFLPSSVRVAKLSPHTLLSEMGKESWQTLAQYCDVLLVHQREIAKEAQSLGWNVHWLKKEELYAVVLQKQQPERDTIINLLITHNQG